MPHCTCRISDTCFEFQHEQRSTVVCKDKGKTQYIYENQSNDFLSKYLIDGGLIANGVKCDFLLLNCDKQHAYFIELKGSDIIHAIEQIDHSIDTLKSQLAKDSKIFARIVLTRVNTNELKNPKYLRLEKKVKSLNGNLKQQTRELKEVV